MIKKKLFEINDSEKNRILNLHEDSTKNYYLNLITEEAIYNPKTEKIQKKLIELGYGDIVGQPDGKYGKQTACAVAKFQADNKNLTVDGKVGTSTASKLGVNAYFPNDVNISNCKNIKVNDEKKSKDLANQNCQSILPDTCSRVKTEREVTINNVGKEGCAEYVRKSLGLSLGNAWDAFIIGKKYGVKYNMFTDGSINWNNVKNKIKSNGINSKKCACFIKEGEKLDIKCKYGSEIAKTISSFYPSSSGVDINSLNVGDIVGMYYGDSLNKGKAFCQRAVEDRQLNANGEFGDTDPFTFNTHVGYVGAIKDGVPLIYHSVHGERLSTPANKLLSKNGSAMIVWVTKSPKTVKRVSSVDKEQEDKPWYSKFSDLF